MTVQNKNKKKRKVSLNTLGIILLIVLAAANFYVLQAKNSSKSQIDYLITNTNMVLQQTARLEQPPDDLKSRLEAVKDEFAAIQADFPNTVDRNEVIDYILEVAGECGVQILPLISDGWTEQALGQSYNVLTVSATAEGNLGDVKKFMTNLQNGKYSTLTIPQCVVARGSAPGIPADSDAIYVSVNMRIGIYTLATALEEDVVS
jgi:hypothetical protein